MKLARFDTLFLRLFVLMWVTLVASHVVAFGLALPLTGAVPPGEMVERMAPDRLPPLAAMPPPDLGTRPGPGLGPRPGGPPGPPPGGGPGSTALWVDYALRALVIAPGAALGARWLAAPMRRLAQASERLSDDLARQRAPQPLDERRGTAEVRRTAAVFNTMARRLQEQFDARGLHLAALSHDLRTPLARLRMRLEDAPEAVAEAAAGDIHEMTEMMDGTLAVLREQRDGQPPGAVDLRAQLQALVDDQQAAGHDVTLADGPPLRACARPVALRRVLDNLVGNALRYGGSAQLSLADGGTHVDLHVDDRGPGIPEAQLAQAFEPWVRLTAQHARAGHGLGLAIARDLAGRDGGTLTLANRPGGGLRATLRLPTNVS